MQKYILSILVIVAFASYAFYYKANTVPEAVVVENTPVVVVVSTTSTPVKVTPVVVKPTPVPTPTPVPPVATLPTGAFRDGTYVGARTYNYHGYIKVEASIIGGKLATITVLEYPTDESDSRKINSRALPKLVKEAISIQSSKVDTVSGATDSSGAFRKSLEAALVQARV